MDIDNNVKVIQEIKYGYDNIIQVGEIVGIIYIYDENFILIETSNEVRVRILKQKVNMI